MSVYQPPERVVTKSCLKSLAERQAMYEKSKEDPEGFWADIASTFHWEKEWTAKRTYNFDVTKGDIDIKWFEGGKTNLCYNALDRHIKAGKADKVAFYWEGNSPGESSQITYGDLLTEVSKFANVLKKHGVYKGTKVTIYIPCVDICPVVLLACCRIGAILNVVFAGFSSSALAGRIENCGSQIIVTADAVMRGAKPIKLKPIVDEAIATCKASGLEINTVIVYERLGRDCAMTDGRDAWYQDEMKDASSECPVEWMESEDPLFLLYTSGSTGKPKGVVHTTGGYMVYAATTVKYIFDINDDDIYWCTADIGWITGHTYVIFGPLLNAASGVIFEGVPTYPGANRCWEIVEKLKISIFYTAPTAIRALMIYGNEHVTKHNRSSLRILGSVGEPINLEAWNWYHEVVGNSQCAIVDTWWQTETGGIMITPLPGSTPLKPSSATFPFWGIEPALLDDKGNEVQGAGEGVLVIKHPHPGMCRTVYGDHKRYMETYYSAYPGYYFTGDGARRDEDGYYFITGRVDDVLNVSGHRLGTAEIENAINLVPGVVESAVVGYPHDIKGIGIYAYVTLKAGMEWSDDVKKAIITSSRTVIGPIATPDIVHHAPGLPKTRSGKIMRRILRKIAESEYAALGDVSTLADPSVVEKLVAQDKILKGSK